MQPDVDYRTCDVELRASEDGATIEGYAAVFDVESEDMGGFREIVRRSAFDKVLAGNPDVVARGNHQDAQLLGATYNGTLRLSVDERGLKYSITPPNTTAARDVVALVKGGYIRKSSFAFQVDKPGQSWEKRSSDGISPLRELLSITRLVDVAPVINPAYGATHVSARTLEAAQAAAAGEIPKDEPTVPNEVNELRLRLSESA